MDVLTRDILTQIQAGKTGFIPENRAQSSILDFQATAKRIEWVKEYGYIKDAKTVRERLGDSLSVVAIEIIGGLTLRGEQALLGDEDD